MPIDKQPKTPNGIPLFIHKCIIFLENKLDSEGIYRVSGVKTRIEKLRLAFNQVCVCTCVYVFVCVLFMYVCVCVCIVYVCVCVCLCMCVCVVFTQV